MANNGERSGLFKFFYVILTIITFPIFAIIYIFKHPVVVLFILLILAGVLAYFPMKDGVELSGAVDWYKKKYGDVKYAVVGKAVESGNTKFIPQEMLNEAKEIKEEMDYKKEEEKREKSELYNDNVIRDKGFDETVQKIKKKGGFKKKVDEEAKEDVDVSGVVEETGNVGGLSNILIKNKETSEVNENIENKIEETKEVVEEIKESTEDSAENLDSLIGDIENKVDDIIEDENKNEDDFDLNLGF